MKIELLESQEGNVLARGSYDGGPDFEFTLAPDGCVCFRAMGQAEMFWAGPDVESFRRIASAWNRYECKIVEIPTEEEQLDRVSKLRQELVSLGALPSQPPSHAQSLWSLLLFEAENGLG